MQVTPTLYQLLHLLRTGGLAGSYMVGVMDVIKAVKEGRVLERDAMGRIFELEGLGHEAFDAAPLMEAPDIAAIEEFVVGCYAAEQ